jgi:D-alanyl-lipoteichoic acid acyltransferase DltB (MBOAT superfamily)
MLFNTWEFLLYFVVVYGLYLATMRQVKVQNAILLVASYVFYGWWDWRFLSLLVVSTVVDYSVALLLERSEESKRKSILLVSMAANLGLLGFFKYFNFFIDSAAQGLQALGLEANLPVLNIVLPVGISFYTFQTMSYTIDVYRRHMPAEKSLMNFAVYVAYFPQLVAGPIERATHLVPQFRVPRAVTWEGVSSGALLMLVGLVRKVAIADSVAAEVNAAFADPGGLSSSGLVRAVILFGVQIYGDFAGYSDMARGLSRMMGIELMENFNHPYFSTNITVFWRRWHISLSTWLRDYLYIPLGGNRGGELATYRNNMLTMLLGGLWHGAAWTFVVWGAIHGAALAVHKLSLGKRKPEAHPEPGPLAVPRLVLSWLGTMVVVHVAWVFFRATSFQNAFDVLGGVFALRGGLELSSWVGALGMVGLLLLIDVPQHLRRDHTAALRWPWPVRGLYYFVLVMAILLLRSEDDVPFIYFQF